MQEYVEDEQRVAIEREVRAVHKEHVQAAERFDFDRMCADYSDAYRAGFNHQGVFYGSAGAYRALFQSFVATRQEIYFDETRVAVLAPNVALLTAHGGFVATGSEGYTFERRTAITYVYAKIGEEWKAVHSHKSFPDQL